MQPVSLLLGVLFLSAGLAAQTSARGTTQGTPPPRRHQHMMAMQQHMQEMKAQIAKMQANVDQMKANAGKIKDPAVRQQADLDAQMWQMMVDHMQGMQQIDRKSTRLNSSHMSISYAVFCLKKKNKKKK